MVLGEDEQIDSATRDDWRDAGLSHLLAVSGQNVMLLMALALPMLVAAGLGPRGRGVALLCLVALYVPLAGAGPSLQRAGVMGAAGIAAMTLSRPSSRWYALLLAAAVTLAMNPRACGDPGWQLSFIAVAGILVAGRPLAARLRRIADELWPPRRAGQTGGALPRAVRDALCEGVAITFAATFATAPLVAHHFGSVPLAGLAANLLALPAVAPAMWLGMVKAALGTLSPLLPGSDRLAELLGLPTHVPIAYLDGLAERCATLPGGRLRLPLHSPAAVVGGLRGAGGAALRAAPRTDRGARAARAPAPSSSPPLWRRSPRRSGPESAMLVAALLVLAAAAVLATPAPPDALTVRFLDIGQGDATLIQDGAGAAALFDGGPPEARVYRLLRAAGVRQARPHGRHPPVARPPGRAHRGARADPDLAAARELRRHEGSRLQAPARRGGRSTGSAGFGPGRASTCGSAGSRSRCSSPAPLPPGTPRPEDPNPRGVAAIVSSGDFDLWLSADAESDAVLPLPLRPVEAMKVSHHGQRTPACPRCSSACARGVAAIEVGADNPYGHPTRRDPRGPPRSGPARVPHRPSTAP